MDGDTTAPSPAIRIQATACNLAAMADARIDVSENILADMVDTASYFAREVVHASFCPFTGNVALRSGQKICAFPIGVANDDNLHPTRNLSQRTDLQKHDAVGLVITVGASLCLEHIHMRPARCGSGLLWRRTAGRCRRSACQDQAITSTV